MVRCSLLLFNISGTTEAVQTRKPDARSGQVSKTPPSINVILNPLDQTPAPEFGQVHEKGNFYDSPIGVSYSKSKNL